LAYRQCVEELVTDEQQRTGRELRDVIGKQRLGRGKPALLFSAQHRAGFDQIEPQRAVERRHVRGRAQQIGHQRAASGTELRQDDRSRRAHLLPQIGAPNSDQFAKDLADLGGGNEIAGAAERIPRA